MYSIYVITNTINGKRYVGYSTKVIERLYDHRRLRGSKLLSAAIKKYGIQNFVVDIVEEGINDQEGLGIREPYWISHLNPEYNMTGGGEGILNYRHSEEARKKISEASSNQIWTEERKRNIGNSIRGKRRPPVSEETRKRLSETQKNRKHSKEHNKKVSLALGKEYDIITPKGEIIRIKGLNKYCQEHNLNQSNMSVRGKSKGYLCTKTKENERAS